MERTALFLLADRALDGQLESMLRLWSEAGVSRRAASKMLALKLGGVELDPNTVSRWMKAVAA
jgi:hypothetical protein